MDDDNRIGEDRIKVVTDFYNAAAPAFAEKTKPWSNQASGRIEKFISLLPIVDLLVVDLACGTGRDVDYLERSGFSSFGVDLSEGMIREAKKTFPEHRYYLGDIVAWNFPGHDQNFRGILLSSALNDIDREYFPQLMEDTTSHLAPEGIFCANFKRGTGVVSFESSEYTNTPIIRRLVLYESEEVTDALQRGGMEILKERAYEVEKQTGIQHKAEIFARKLQ